MPVAPMENPPSRKSNPKCLPAVGLHRIDTTQRLTRNHSPVVSCSSLLDEVFSRVDATLSFGRSCCLNCCRKSIFTAPAYPHVTDAVIYVSLKCILGFGSGRPRGKYIHRQILFLRSVEKKFNREFRSFEPSKASAVSRCRRASLTRRPSRLPRGPTFLRKPRLSPLQRRQRLATAPATAPSTSVNTAGI